MLTDGGLRLREKPSLICRQIKVDLHHPGMGWDLHHPRVLADSKNPPFPCQNKEF